MTEMLIEMSLRLPAVRYRQSRMAAPDVRALYLPDAAAAGPADAFIDGHEFCHLHPPPEGGAHLTLPDAVRDRALELGWAESHATVKAGAMPKSLVLVYAPRNTEELQSVLTLVRVSCQFAKGL